MIVVAVIQEPVQQADAGFFAPVAIAYLAVCALWFVARRAAPRAWDGDPAVRPPRPWIDGLVALVVLAGVLGLGQLWRQDALLARGGGLLWFNVNQLIIWSPLFVALAVRRQSLATIYLSPCGLAVKLTTGVVLALVGTALFLGLRGDLDQFGSVLADTATAHAVGHLLPVFLEGVGLVFLFERLRWCVGTSIAIVGPCLCFAIAHVPGAVEAGHSTGHIAAFFAFNTLLPIAILFTVWRSRDVIWIGIVHWVLDVAIDAF